MTVEHGMSTDISPRDLSNAIADLSELEITQLHQVIVNRIISKGELGILYPLGEGGCANIFCGTWNGRSVAIKESKALKCPHTNRARTRDMLQELRAVSQLFHPNIAGFEGVGIDVRKPWIGLVFELCEEGSLHDVIHIKRKALDSFQKINIAYGTALALEYVHSQRFAHLDLNSKNILLDSSFSAKLADFGCARPVSARTSLVDRCPSVVGTPAYMPHEQLAGLDLTPRVDVWALALVMVELAAEAQPWSGPVARSHPLTLRDAAAAA
eukprot:CAMPEP_0113706410 /NCGR_PEP_ID=MMETSP0038_2-20120614/27705_1 /TAXON_ID=2898 /ORGANISM="Cryptomonas paramecium" /LENGTH=268 /DNA_ID=CAMNT_0000631591 /DNA_START=137 /DNA_END=939 /DNA_ORIENTATION=- /assembly_acc=CAM_ASM_000170